MRICSFLPSATEILYALGAGDSVAGVTFECDFPAEAAGKKIIVRTRLASGLTPLEIDDAVREQAAQGGSLYYVDETVLAQIQPELVITQDLCKVCAIDTEQLGRALGRLASNPEVLSLEPQTLEEVFLSIDVVAKAIGRQTEARTLLGELRARVERVRASRGAARRPRVLCLEWMDPLYQGGHWIPEMVALAGGEAVLASAGEKSVRLTWEQVFAVDPEVLVVMPCGFHLEEAAAQYRATAFPQPWARMTAVRTGQVYAVDGTAYFSRPGPRLVTGVEVLQAIFRGGDFALLPPSSVARLTEVEA